MSSRACDYPSFSSLAHSSPVLLMSLSDIAPSVNYTLSLHDALPIYENRSLTYVFEIKQQDYERRKINQTAIENWLKKDGVAPLYDDHARGYYYMAKCTSVNTDDFYGGLRVTTTWDAYPFKISELPEGHDIWDEFNFELDASTLNEFQVNGELEVNLFNIGASSRVPVIKIGRAHV